MVNVLLKINRALRNLILIVGTVMAVIKITETKERESNTSDEGFQIKEFDDIW